MGKAPRTVGAWTFELERLHRRRGARLRARARGLGFQALWIPESLGSKEIFAHAGLLLAASQRLIIASGIANMWARDATAMANGQRTLAEAYPGRFLLGLGVSHAPVVKMRGASYDKPVESMARYLEAMDKAPYTGGLRRATRPRARGARSADAPSRRANAHSARIRISSRSSTPRSRARSSATTTPRGRTGRGPVG